VLVANELVQWAVMLFLAMMVLGLARHLGAFIVPRRDDLALAGPPVGKKLPGTLASSEELDHLRKNLPEDASYGLVAVVSEDCVGCQALVSQLQYAQDRQPFAPLGAVASGSPDFLHSLEDVFGVVFDDSNKARSHQSGIYGVPFVMIVDRDFIVRHSTVDSNLERIAQAWRQAILEDDETEARRVDTLLQSSPVGSV
jgi:hypothetical protein